MWYFEIIRAVFRVDFLLIEADDADEDNNNDYIDYDNNKNNLNNKNKNNYYDNKNMVFHYILYNLH